MRRIPTARLALPLALAALAAGLGATLASESQGQQGRALRRFMRQKLEYSQNILEGLALEDYALVARNARSLRELSEDAQWRVSPNVNYLRLSNEFQALADELEQKAKDRNLDGATLGFFRLTNNCIDCHKLVREHNLISRVVGGDAGRRAGRARVRAAGAQ